MEDGRARKNKSLRPHFSINRSRLWPRGLHTRINRNLRCLSLSHRAWTRRAQPLSLICVTCFWSQTNFFISVRRVAMFDQFKHHSRVSTRREFFTSTGSGLAAIALASLLEQDGFAQTADPLAAKKPHVIPKAKNVIFCFMEGGPSHVDLFD